MNRLFIILLFFTIAFLCPEGFVFASTENGFIDNSYKYAWSENAGWLNFGADNGNVRVTDSGLSGYAWNENYGWINLNTDTSGVLNNAEGTLSGYAWSEGMGWINFSGVTIDRNGEFSGTATGDISGQISFNCSNCKVKTDWRPLSSRAGGVLPPAAYSSPVLPLKIVIDNNSENTASKTVTLNFQAGQDIEMMAVSNYSDFRGSVQENYSSVKSWDLCFQRPAETECPSDNTVYTVYAKFYTKQWGRGSEAVSDSIVYAKEIPKKTFIERLPEILKPYIPEFLRILKREVVKPPEIPLEEQIPKEAPLSLRKKWLLLDPAVIGQFVFAPLPKDLKVLVQKFPQLQKTFSEVNITRMTELNKLRAAELRLPGLTETVGLPTAEIGLAKFSLPKGIPIAELSPKAKQQFPSEIVFAKTGGELIDFSIVLFFGEDENVRQRITTVSGKPLQLTVKPEKDVKSVKGYLVFKSPRPKSEAYGSDYSLQNLTASLVFAAPNFVKPQKYPLEKEQELILEKFDYSDFDKDGIYTSEIKAPLIEGEYEIVTMMEYKDPAFLRVKENRLTMVVDPEGYIYERSGDRQTRISGAIVSFYWLNPETKSYELWPAKNYQQENPQTSDITGKYSFLVPEGHYYLTVVAPGYLTYDGKPFQVKESSGVHINIELKTKYWWLKIVDFRTVLLAMVILLLIYNFYRDRIRAIPMFNPRG